MCPEYVPRVAASTPSFAADLRSRLRVDRRRGPQWYAKYRLPDGRQVQRRIGPAWTGRGRPAAGHFTKRSAQAWLDEVLAQARRGDLPGMVETGATVADAAAEWLRWAQHDRDCKPSTLADYRSTSRLIVRDLGALRLEDVTPQLLERWKTTIPGSNRNVQKRLVVLHGIFKRAMRVWGLPRNPVADVERPRVRVSTDVDAFSPEGDRGDEARLLADAFRVEQVIPADPSRPEP